MVRRSKLLTKLRNKTAAVADAMATVSLFLEGQADSFTTVCGCKFEVDVIKDNFTPLSKLLDEALDCIREDWNTIIPNDMLLDEVRKAIDACSSLQKNVIIFDDTAVAHSDDFEDLFGDDWLSRAYLDLISGWMDETEAIRSYIDRNCAVGLRLDDPFRNVAYRLRHFFTGVTDDDIREFVMNGVSLAHRAKWIGDKNQAVVMGKMLRRSCKEMNESFLFAKDDGTPILLNYTQHGPRLDLDQYEIYGLIRMLLDATSGNSD